MAGPLLYKAAVVLPDSPSCEFRCGVTARGALAAPHARRCPLPGGLRLYERLLHPGVSILLGRFDACGRVLFVPYSTSSSLYSIHSILLQVEAKHARMYTPRWSMPEIYTPCDTCLPSTLQIAYTCMYIVALFYMLKIGNLSNRNR